jgi:hypothetical protein
MIMHSFSSEKPLTGMVPATTPGQLSACPSLAAGTIHPCMSRWIFTNPSGLVTTMQDPATFPRAWIIAITGLQHLSAVAERFGAMPQAPLRLHAYV